MKKLWIVLLLFLIFAVPVQATGTSEEYFDSITDAAGRDIKQILSDIGIENGSFDELLSVDFRKVADQFLRLCRNEMKRPMQTSFCICILLLILSVLRPLISSDNELTTSISSISAIMSAMLLLLPISETLAQVMSVFVATHDFMKVLIPVFAGIITAFGKPTLAVCLQGAVFSTAQIIASVFRTSLPSVCVVYSSLSICSCSQNGINTNHLAQLMKKLYLSVLAFCAALFSSLLTVKSVIASSADTVTVKGIKFIVGNSVPVVGGALSEALNSVISGVALLKSTIGIIAVIILILMNLPILTELLMWSLSLKVLSAIAGLADMNEEVTLLDSMAGLFSMLSAVVIYQAFLYIISISMIAVVAGMR